MAPPNVYSWGMALLASLRRPKLQTSELTESAVMQTIPADRIDRERGILRDVKIIGHQSKNHGGKRRYTDKAIAGGVPLYEGAEVNLNHPKGNKAAERSLIEGWGVLRETRKTDDGARGELHFLVNHPDTPWLLERIEKGMPIGLSHNARGKTRMVDGEQIVESIDVVNSVDLVTRPATVKNLLESEQPTVSTTLRKLIESTGYKFTTELVEMLPEEVDAMATMEVPAEDEVEKADPVEAVKQALADEAVKIFLDPQIDPAETGKKIKDLAKAAEDVANKVNPAEVSEEPSEETDDEEEKPVEESVKKLVSEAVKAATKELTESFRPTLRKVAAQDFLDSRKINRANVPAEKLKALQECEDDAAMSKLVESWPPFIRGAAPPAASTNNTTQPRKAPRLINARRG